MPANYAVSVVSSYAAQFLGLLSQYNQRISKLKRRERKENHDEEQF